MLVIVSLFTILTWALAGVSLAYLMVSAITNIYTYVYILCNYIK